jgi:hypothetical protein
MVAGLKSKEYKEKCSELGLETLEQRRMMHFRGLEESECYTDTQERHKRRSRQLQASFTNQHTLQDYGIHH